MIPFFIEKAAPGAQPRRWHWLESTIPLLMLAWLAALLLGQHGVLLAALAGLIAAAHALRLAGWHHPGVWRNPMLWILFIGYSWVVIGFALIGAYEAGWLARSPALHALTAGGIGVLTIGMMARVSLGHTGRDMKPARLTVLVFWLINSAALVRVAGPVLLPGGYTSWVTLSGLLWLLALAGFSLVYAPILLRARVDGRPD